MKSSTSHKRRTPDSEHFVLNRERGEKISAVEGMKLTERMRDILEFADKAALSGDERRSLIREQLRKK